MVFQHTCYREYLRSVFADKQVSSPRFSLRSMAKQLRVSPSLLCEVQRGRKNLSIERAVSVGKKLGLSDSKLDYFCTLVQRELAKEEAVKSELSEKLARLNPARATDVRNVDTLNELSDWYYIPILALFDLPGFAMTPKAIAAKLGIAETDAAEALRKLKDGGLICRNERGKLVRQVENASFESGRFHLGLRAFHRHMLVRASRALEKQTPLERMTQTETLAIHPSDLPAARRILATAMAEVVKLCDAHPEKKEIYHLHLQFFRLSKRGVK